MLSLSPASRRHFLRGAGGFTLAMPFLPSLQKAALGDPNPNRPRRFVAFATGHGALWYENMFPPEATLTERASVLGYEARWGRLAPTMEGTSGKLSPVLRGPASVLTPKLAAKFNVLRGLDVPTYESHHTGGHLGNFREYHKEDFGELIPTIDHVMAWSPSFYPNLSGIKERSISCGFTSLSWGWSNPGSRSGVVQRQEVNANPTQFFDKFFAGAPPVGMPQARRKPIIDLVMANYQSLRQSNRRLSADDRRRLDDHIARLSELQRKVNVIAPAASCGNRMTPGNTDGLNFSSDFAKYTSTINSVIAAILACDLSRIATFYLDNGFEDHYSGDWHQDVAHQGDLPEKQQKLVLANQFAFANGILDLANKLDAIDDGGGATLLDSSLLVWTQESGRYTHDSDSIPIVTAGSAGGYFKTGLYCDYRNKAPTAQIHFSNGTLAPERYVGLTYHRYLGTVLQSMGVPRGEYEKPGTHGYGNFMPAWPDNQYVNRGRSLYVPGVIESASEPLPLITGV